MGSVPEHPLVQELLSRCWYPASGSSVRCAVSGGADSTALMILAVAAGCIVEAVHVDHGLRAGSVAEGTQVAATAERFGATSTLRRAAVTPGPNLEARARALRYEILGPDALIGHTVDDQAETVLLNLVRGAGVRGLGGMRSDVRRPMLALRRAETHALCQALDVPIVEDPTNLDTSFRRNRVRHELVPLLDDIAQRDVAAVIARQATLLAEVDDLLVELAVALDVRDAKALVAAKTAVARVAVREWLITEVSPEHPPDAATIERVMAVAEGHAVGTEVGQGYEVRRSQNRLRLQKSP